MCKHALIAFKLFIEDNRHIRRIMTTFNNGRGIFHTLLLDSHYSSSNTEQTIQSYSTSDVLSTSIILVTKPDGINYPNYPCNIYVSKWSDGFSDCLACDSTTYQVVPFHEKYNAVDKNVLTGNLCAFSLNQEKKSDSFPRVLTPPQSNVDIHSTQTAAASRSANYVPHSTNIDKRHRVYTFCPYD